MTQGTAEPVLATVKEAGVILGLTPYQVRKLIANGRLRRVQILTSVRVPLDDVRRLAMEGTR